MGVRQTKEGVLKAGQQGKRGLVEQQWMWVLRELLARAKEAALQRASEPVRPDIDSQPAEPSKVQRGGIDSAERPKPNGFEASPGIMPGYGRRIPVTGWAA